MPPSSKLHVQAPSNGNTQSAITTAGTARPPKKGSYAEIMARGKAAQAILGQMGKIQHKPLERGLSKRERQEIKGQKAHSHRESDKKHNSTGRKPIGSKGTSIRESNGEKLEEQLGPHGAKKVKKAAIATTGYTGTARPLKSSSNFSRVAAQSRSGGSEGRGHATQSSRRYTYASEEEDEPKKDYNSDASSDMEAAAFEVDEEEEFALRVARQEDAEALKEENQHKREKEEKRRRLVEMARSRR